MTFVHLTILNLIITTLFVYGQDSIADECIPIYKLLKKPQSDNCCSEDGIECDQGHIETISFFKKGLSGSIPSELGTLTQLKALNLNENELSGSIPPELGNLSQLQYLNLYHNKLSGSIPTKLGDLSQLRTLSLYNNNLNGTIPQELKSLTQLQYLDLSYNNLNGSIPSGFENFKVLEHLDLSYNNLTGPIPSGLKNLQFLEKFDVSGNDLCGEVPEFQKCEIISAKGNEYLYEKCPGDETQQNKKIDADNKSNNNGNSSITTLIIIGVCALLLALIVLVYFKNNKKNKNVNKSCSKISNHSDNENLHISEKDSLLDYTFIEKQYFEWKIENWDQLKDEEFSSAFEARKHLWKLMLITNSFNENNEESIDVGLSLYDEINDSECIYANFIIFFRNYNNDNVYKIVKYDEKPTIYNAKTLNHGINDVILKSELYDKTNDGCSLLENNKIIIGILIHFYLPNSVPVINGSKLF